MVLAGIPVNLIASPMVLVGIPDNSYSVAYDTVRLASCFSRHTCKFDSIAYGVARHACELNRIYLSVGETPTEISSLMRHQPV